MPRLVRRKPFGERLMAMLNPMDFLLWLSEELETREWDSKLVGTQIGLGLNFVFLVARANTGGKPDDDIFRDEASSGWFSLLVSTTSPALNDSCSHICAIRSIPWFGASSSSLARTLSTL